MKQTAMCHWRTFGMAVLLLAASAAGMASMMGTACAANGEWHCFAICRNDQGQFVANPQVEDESAGSQDEAEEQCASNDPSAGCPEGSSAIDCSCSNSEKILLPDGSLAQPF